MEYHFNEKEIACIKRMAEMFEEGNCYVNANLDDEEGDGTLDAPLGERAAILETMQSFGLIAEVVHAATLRFFSFKITAKSVQIARAIKAQQVEELEPEDLVEKLQTTARKNPVVAWIIIGFFVLTAAATLINQTIQIFQNIGWMTKP